MEKNLSVCFSEEKEDFEKINANFIYNRFDLQEKECTRLIKVTENEQVRYIPIYTNGNTAQMGISLDNTPAKNIRTAMRFAFAQFPSVRTIKYQSGCCSLGIYSSHNYYIVNLPDSVEELHNRSSAKTRQTLRRKIRIVEKELGAFSIKEYTAETVPDEVVEKYFLMKYATHNTDYGLPASEYLQKYYVTNIYALYVQQEVGAIILSCEQCPGVYLENLSYDVKYAKYSLGTILYDLYLDRLVEKQKRELYLAGGDIAYKKRNGSVEHTVYDGVVYRQAVREYAVRIYRLFRGVCRRIKKTLCRRKPNEK